MATFDERAKGWDTPERIRRAADVADAIRAVVPLAQTDRLIDVGSGTGLLGLALADDVAEVVLSDPSAGMIAVADEKLRAGGLGAVRAIRHDLLAGPPSDERFDVAVSLLVLHHIVDTAAALAAIRELLVPGGRIGLVDLDTEDGSFHGDEAEGIHHFGFDRVAIERLAREAGFSDVATSTAAIVDCGDRPAAFSAFVLTGRRPA